MVGVSLLVGPGEGAAGCAATGTVRRGVPGTGARHDEVPRLSVFGSAPSVVAWWTSCPVPVSARSVRRPGRNPEMCGGSLTPPPISRRILGRCVHMVNALGTGRCRAFTPDRAARRRTSAHPPPRTDRARGCSTRKETHW
ncbi:hypothetical protein GCM10020366_38520 [Saccharopolyspora gregorii]|uniref:Secreted protein n=1 Tax=Saccharopolyspora gregorii TaxID=33914 RepID=A0ABP6RU74_9PSEU